MTLPILEGEVNSMSAVNKARSGALPPPPISEIQQVMGSDSMIIEWLAGDGSDRCYYRLIDQEVERSYVLMQLSGSDAIALSGGEYEWIHMANILEENGIFIPKVIATLPEFAAIIIEDYGNLMLENYAIKYQNEILSDVVHERYIIAVKIICKMLNIKQNQDHVWCTRAFDKERFLWELNFFKEKYIEGILGYDMSKTESRHFEKDSEALSEFLGQHSKYFVHRDYHSRNLMVNKNFMAVLDFQDARIGPSSYDVVSLIFDSYVPLSNTQRLQLLDDTIKLVKEKVSVTVAEEIANTWKAMLLQRQYKALGSFGYLTTEKNRGNYLKYCFPAMQTILDNQIGNDRWPYLSRKLPQIITERLGT